MPPSIKNKYQNLKNPSASQEVPILKIQSMANMAANGESGRNRTDNLGLR